MLAGPCRSHLARSSLHLTWIIAVPPEPQCLPGASQGEVP